MPDVYGNIAGYANGSGTVVDAVLYSPFGRALSSANTSGGVVFPIGFSGQYTDWETNLVYYGKRFYNPKHGRFINRDPIEEEGGNNLYAFVANRSTNAWDNLGLTPQSAGFYASNTISLVGGILLSGSAAASEGYSLGLDTPLAAPALAEGAAIAAESAYNLVFPGMLGVGSPYKTSGLLSGVLSVSQQLTGNANNNTFSTITAFADITEGVGTIALGGTGWLGPLTSEGMLAASSAANGDHFIATSNSLFAAALRESGTSGSEVLSIVSEGSILGTLNNASSSFAGTISTINSVVGFGGTISDLVGYQSPTTTANFSASPITYAPLSLLPTNESQGPTITVPPLDGSVSPSNVTSPKNTPNAGPTITVPTTFSISASNPYYSSYDPNGDDTTPAGGSSGDSGGGIAPSRWVQQ